MNGNRSNIDNIHKHSVIGIDCATLPEKVGLALAHMDNGNLLVDEVALGSKREEPVTIISEWMKRSDQVLLAFDAPLALARSLVAFAGKP